MTPAEIITAALLAVGGIALLEGAARAILRLVRRRPAPRRLGPEWFPRHPNCRCILLPVPDATIPASQRSAAHPAAVAPGPGVGVQVPPGAPTGPHGAQGGG